MSSRYLICSECGARHTSEGIVPNKRVRPCAACAGCVVEKRLNVAPRGGYVPITEAAKLIGLKPKTLRNWKYKKKLLPKHGLRKIGGRVAFDPDLLRAAVERGDLAA